MYRLRNRLSLRAKIKALWSFFQITSKLDKVYEVRHRKYSRSKWRVESSELDKVYKVRAPLPHSLTSPLTSPLTNPLTILPPRYLTLVTLLPSPSPPQVPMPSTYCLALLPYAVLALLPYSISITLPSPGADAVDGGQLLQVSTLHQH